MSGPGQINGKRPPPRPPRDGFDEPQLPGQAAASAVGALDAYVGTATGAGASASAPFDNQFAALLIKAIGQSSHWPALIDVAFARLCQFPESFDPVAAARLWRLKRATEITPILGPAIEDPRRARRARGATPKELSVPLVHPLLRTWIHRDGCPDIKLWTLTALFLGEIPPRRAGRTYFSNTMSRIAGRWFGGDLAALAKVAGMEQSTIEGLVRGTRILRHYRHVRRLAANLGVEASKLFVPWYTDFYAARLQALDPRRYSDPEEVRQRAQDLVDMAAARLETRGTWSVFSDLTIRKAVMLCFFCMTAGFHPQLVVPMISGAFSAGKDFFKQIERFVARQQEDKHPWDAAIASYLAEHLAEDEADPALILSLVVGADRLLEGARRPRWLSEAAEVTLREHYLSRALEVHGAIMHNLEKSGAPRVEIVDGRDLAYARTMLQELREVQRGGPARKRGPLVEDDGMASYGADEWRLITGKLKQTDMYGALQRSGRWDLVREAFRANGGRRSQRAFFDRLRLLEVGAGILREPTDAQAERDDAAGEVAEEGALEASGLRGPGVLPELAPGVPRIATAPSFDAMPVAAKKSF